MASRSMAANWIVVLSRVPRNMKLAGVNFPESCSLQKVFETSSVHHKSGRRTGAISRALSDEFGVKQAFVVVAAVLSKH
eukprot:1805937-Amphidinium_carterae.1